MAWLTSAPAVCHCGAAEFVKGLRRDWALVPESPDGQGERRRPRTGDLDRRTLRAVNYGPTGLNF